MAKKCCPRIRVACKKVGGERVTHDYWTLKTPFSKPVKHTASAQIPARVKCAVTLGKRAVSEYMPLDSPRIDKALERYKKSVAAQGCSDTSVTWGNVPNAKSPTYSKNASGPVLDKLKAKVAAKTRR